MSSLHCKYAYKQCSAPRAIKRNGNLHNLCAYHRQRANAVQKKHISKRSRMLMASPMSEQVIEDDELLANVLIELACAPEPIRFDTPNQVSPAIDSETLTLLLGLGA
ncbi:hypothetical protein THRCLA_22147 [Thraustotheca clavata]|uniref:Uncharacterized protein n=1 Tax=Thraustotheca clavata TaxID=74557 RepID=A0A1V9ZBP3_9STRA|nr:hypothetical protein THRCLA_22147 [Thraustotheca clavata]